MKWPRYIGKPLALALALPLIVAWLAPATWLDAALRESSRGALGLGDAQGRLWDGSGTLQALLPRGEAVTLAVLRWTPRFTPWSGRGSACGLSWLRPGTGRFCWTPAPIRAA